MEKTHYNKQDADAESDGQNTLLNIEDGRAETEPSQAESQSQSVSDEPSRHLSSIEVLQAEPESQSVSVSIQAIEPESHQEPSREPESHQEPSREPESHQEPSQSQKPSQEPQESKTEPQQKEPESQSQSVSINPSIAEIERFISFINKKFNIEPPNNLIVLIQKTEPQIKGYYSPNSWRASFKHQDATQEPEHRSINEITLSSINLIFEPYETIAHEYAHFLNTYLDKYEGNGRNYHTLQFKQRAEQLLLRVEKGNYGYNQTYETDAFKDMIAEFKPSQDAFKIFQPTDSRIIGIDGNGKPYDKDGNIVKPEPKGKSRLLLYSCSCGFKIRTARNKDKPLKALCLLCNTEFKEVIKDDAKPEPSKTEPTPEPSPEDATTEPEQDKPTLSPEPEPRAEPERAEDDANHREQEVDFYNLVFKRQEVLN